MLGCAADEVYAARRVAIANAPAPAARDKLNLCLCRKMIRYYLDEEPIIENVPTYICAAGCKKQGLRRPPQGLWQIRR